MRSRESEAQRRNDHILGESVRGVPVPLLATEGTESGATESGVGAAALLGLSGSATESAIKDSGMPFWPVSGHLTMTDTHNVIARARYTRDNGIARARYALRKRCLADDRSLSLPGPVGPLTLTLTHTGSHA